MLTRIVLESLARRRRRKLLSVAAVALGLAVATAVGTIALDVGDKVSRELRSFGANIAVTPAADGLSVAVGGVDYRPAGSGAFLAEADLAKLKKIFWRNNLMAFAPFLYAPATVKGRSTVLIGTWFQKQLPIDKSEVFETGLKRLHPDWKVEGRWPQDQTESAPPGCLMGRRLAGRLGARVGEGWTVETPAAGPGIRPGLSSSTRVELRGILDSGSAEDDQILVPLAVVQRLTGLEGKVRRVEVSALTKPEDAFARSDVTKLAPEEFDRWYCTPYVSSIAYQIQQALPDSQARPVYQVAETEGKILNRVGILMGLLAAAALIVAALAVASMMLATVLERRTEIGLFKALGATDTRVGSLFLLEACGVGLVGGIAGYFLGSLLAWRLAVLVFGVPITLHWVIFPACVALALLVTLVGSAMPMSRVLKISPAVVLRD